MATYEGMPPMYLLLDRKEWEQGYDIGLSIDEKLLDESCKGKSKAFRRGLQKALQKRKAKEGAN